MSEYFVFPHSIELVTSAVTLRHVIFFNRKKNTEMMVMRQRAEEIIANSEVSMHSSHVSDQLRPESVC